MEENSRLAIPVNEDTLEVTRSMRDVQPVHYTFKIESFSLLFGLLEECKVDKHESRDFEAGGYKWRLLLYPNGNNEGDANGHISLYLAMSDTNDLPLGWEVNATFKFLVYDQIRDKYLTLQDGRVRRFHYLKRAWGIPRLISLGTLNNPSNGYLINDCCVFGVDVFVMKCEGKGETFSITKEPDGGTFTWKLDRFSGMSEEDSYFSEKFTVGGHQWKLMVYPNGDSRGRGKYFSTFLYLLDDYSALCPGCKFYVKWTTSIKDQVHGENYKKKGNRCFSALSRGWGHTEFISLTDLYDARKGFIVNDTLIVETKITLISVISYFE